MNDIEKKLAEYRAQKEREFRYNKLKENLNSLFSSPKQEEKNTPPASPIKEGIDNLIPSDCESDALSDCDDANLNCCSYVDWAYYILCFTLWSMLYLIFIKLQFGTVFLITSALVGIYYNTRTEPKRKGEVSAYSVFNKDCKSIDGTLKAEQFEREIRYGPAVVR